MEFGLDVTAEVATPGFRFTVASNRLIDTVTARSKQGSATGFAGA